MHCELKNIKIIFEESLVMSLLPFLTINLNEHNIRVHKVI